ncbi:hypothetical protein RclHR1_04820010 [Rhizophagus clarus]|uniref:Uncharacterized protein n=1 Tax=Rhizophagus clarus TaxID=94130 RepID=A0A2Z6S232_9GLOM|nr:hypothetical protein RclHR1_04820010 [Rhizophagus clarus]
MRIKLEDQDIATSSSTSNGFSDIRARYSNEKNNKSENIEKFFEKYVPQHVLIKMEEIYNQLNDISQKAVVCLKEIHEFSKQIPKPTLVLLTLIGLLLFYITSIILSIIYLPATDLICKITPYSDSVFPFCKFSIPNFTDLVDAQVETQRRLLEQAAELDSEGSLAHDIKNAELATKDLILVVKYSELQYRQLLIKKLEEFAGASFNTNNELQTLQVRAQTSLDNTLTYIAFTLKAIGEFDGKVVNPRKRRDLTKLHDSLMKLTDEDLRKLIIATDKALKSLKRLDELQSSIHAITSQEENLQKINQEELLSNLWSLLGGNKVEKNIFEDNFNLLKILDTQRKIAVERIASIMECLEKFQKQLNILREETVTRLLVGIPVEVQLTNIKKALMRLQTSEISAGAKKFNTAENTAENTENDTENDTEGTPI